MKQLNYEKVFSPYFGIYAFASLVFPKITSIMMVLMIIVMIIGHIKKQFLWKFNWPSVFFVALYFIYIIGIFFSADQAEGWKYAEYKMSILILPLLFSVVPKFNFQIKYTVYGLVAGIIVLTISGVLNSLNCYSGHTVDWIIYCFTSSFISPVHHPSYFACFIIFSVAALIYGKKQNWWGINGYSFFLYTLLASTMYILCLSLAGILFLGLVFVVLILRYLYTKLGIKLFVPLSLTTVFLVVFVGANLPIVKHELKSTAQSYSQFMNDPDAFLFSRKNQEYIPGNEVRLIMWKISVDLIFEHPFGVGTGSVDEFLNARLRRYGLHQLANESYNPHNQYLQTTLEIGFIGLFVLLGLIVSVIHFSIRHHSYLLLLLISGLAFNCLFESMFQRQSGIVFYSFWINLLLFNIKANEFNERN